MPLVASSFCSRFAVSAYISALLAYTIDIQYLNSVGIITVNWSKVGARYNKYFATPDETGKEVAPTVGRLFGWLINFLTADFAPRATFLAGFMLGLRVG